MFYCTISRYSAIPLIEQIKKYCCTNVSKNTIEIELFEDSSDDEFVFDQYKHDSGSDGFETSSIDSDDRWHYSTKT